MECFSGIIKIIMFIFNFLCLLVGLVLVVLGSIIYVSIGGYSMPQQLTVIPMVIIIVGVFVFLVSFLGCCGAIKENKCMLLTYAVILIIMLVIDFSFGTIVIVNFNNQYDNVKQMVIDELSEILNKYGKDDSATTAMDAIQLALSCCGVNSKSDYSSIIHSPSLLPEYPGSCCGKTEKNELCSFIETVDTKGCGEVLFSTIDYYVTTIITVIYVICAIELLGAIFAIFLSRKK